MAEDTPFNAVSDPANDGVYVKPYHLRQQEDWAIDQERQRHADALHRVGEYSIFVMMWTVIDFEHGLVDRCSTCSGPDGSRQDRIADVYKQPKQNKCPDCYGTHFDGGIRAKIVRPAIWADANETEHLDRRGAVHPDAAGVESTWDFRMHQGDYIIRADGSRWRLPDSPRRTTLRTGFAHPNQREMSINYGRIQARYEEPTTVVYMIPPTDLEYIEYHLTKRSLFPMTFPHLETINAPLIPTHGLRD